MGMERQTYFRKIIRITAEDSPNVRLARAEIGQGRQSSGRQIVPGVLPWGKYQHRLATWDEVRQCIGLNAMFWEGAEFLLYPPVALNRSSAAELHLRSVRRRGRAMGIDPAEGGDKSCWSIVDDHGLMEQISIKTPDTNVIPTKTIALMNEYGISPHKVAFDRGGGGKQHADRLRAMGYAVRSFGFGERPTTDIKYGPTQVRERREVAEEKYAYLNLRAEMYHKMSLVINTPEDVIPFCIPERFYELRRQLALIPRLYADEGRIKLPSKSTKKGSKEPSLTQIIGNSPDEADSLVLAYHILYEDDLEPKVGVLFE